MTGLVEDLLLLARLDAGRPLDRAPVDLAALAVDAVTDAHAAGPDHDWALDLPGAGDLDVDPASGTPDPDDLPDDAVDLEVTGDEASLRQVLANLLANARRHTPPGTHVDVRVTTDADAVVLAVSDDGPGIPAALRPALFRRFTRGDDARNRTGGSTGLGLAIVDAIVTAHGGTIVTSATADEPGSTGTTVAVRLPATALDVTALPRRAGGRARPTTETTGLDRTRLGTAQPARRTLHAAVTVGGSRNALCMFWDARRPEIAYLVGLLQTDGCHDGSPDRKGRITLELAVRDRDVLEGISSLLLATRLSVSGTGRRTSVRTTCPQRSGSSTRPRGESSLRSV